MVFVNNKKFACESCIKGHRSSSCHHTDRPLFEIKKKGRPVSQCEKCRQLRQARRFHSKCNCPQDEQPSRGLLLPSSSTKSRRYIPIAPALPNGLRDVLSVSSSTSVPPDSRQRVDSLLNPCNCRSGWKCKCRATAASSPPGPAADDGLATLARAAAMCCHTSDPIPRPSLNSSPGPRKDAAPSKRQTSRPNSPTHHASGAHKRPKHIPSERPAGPALAPILSLYSDDPALPSPTMSIPIFALMPPMSTLTSLAGSGCTCGLECACPGCVEHRGPEHADRDRPSCADGCGTCVDARAGVALPGFGFDSSPFSPSSFSFDFNSASSNYNLDNAGSNAGASSSSSASTSTALTNSIIDQFLARAAALPAPPTYRNRTAGVNIDPMNVAVYSGTEQVNLPKLECCGGQCSCPAGSCDCRQSCNGCCSEHHRIGVRGSSRNMRGNSTSGRNNGSERAGARASPAKVCCAS
ncbi:hypothetical protein K438DRAFT_1804564 [Mycena galopus ATCC 62051]|nr:hypothetical protein K438DRAFT_1804564 [Mycena galopus ATCC 62051]